MKNLKLEFNRYPVDIIICIFFNIFLSIILLLSINNIIRIIIGIPFVLFVPGYTLIFALFPNKKGEKGINSLERLSLSLGFSIVITSMLGLLLGLTRLNINLFTILTSLFFFTIVTSFIAIYRWIKIPPNERFIISFKFSTNRFDNIFTIITAFTIIIALVSITHLMIPTKGENFTQFYILGLGENQSQYPRDIHINEKISVTIGLVNHEYVRMSYNIELWLINETIFFNESKQEKESIYNHMWYIDTIEVVLNHSNINELPQWEYNYSFSINKTGEFKLAFLLYTTPQDTYHYFKDYSFIAKQKIENAYKNLHLWCTIYHED